MKICNDAKKIKIYTSTQKLNIVYFFLQDWKLNWLKNVTVVFDEVEMQNFYMKCAL